MAQAFWPVLPTAEALPVTDDQHEATPFASLVVTIRWATVVISAAVVALRGPRSAHVLVWGLVLLGFAVVRQVRPIALSARDAAAATPLHVIVETGLVVSAVVSTGYWGSPFAFSLVTPVIMAGFVRGFGFAARVAAATCLLVAVPGHLAIAGWSYESLQVSGQWTIELLLVALLAGYSRRLFGEAEERHSLALDRMSQLTEANDLLVSLHRVAQSLPASLNLDQVIASTMARLRTLVDCDVTAVLRHDDATGRWVVGASEGLLIRHPLDDHDLPRALAAAARSSVASLVVSLAPGEGIGDELTSQSGLYAPLRARGALVGLLALEHHQQGQYGRRELRLLDGFIGPAALAIDNARWFGRLRTMGADEERNRIARDMHDSVGQSLAYLGFKLDRIAPMAEDQPLRGELDSLRSEVRAVLGEVRDTLSDLRTDVSDQHSLVETLESFLERVRARADFEVTFRHEQTGGRLPLVRERELWRIAQEAITNVERHARATHLRVRWWSDGREAVLAVADDGRGFDPDRAGRADSYGITGMRERADAIDARLSIETEPFVGTIVECRLEARP
jgi:signal transduction histidine kinase